MIFPASTVNFGSNRPVPFLKILLLSSHLCKHDISAVFPLLFFVRSVLLFLRRFRNVLEISFLEVGLVLGNEAGHLLCNMTIEAAAEVHMEVQGTWHLALHWFLSPFILWHEILES